MREKATVPACSAGQQAGPPLRCAGARCFLGLAGRQVPFVVAVEDDDDMIGDKRIRAGFRFSAEDFPVRLSATISSEIFWPSLRSRIPARSTALIWTNTSLLPWSG